MQIPIDNPHMFRMLYGLMMNPEAPAPPPFLLDMLEQAREDIERVLLDSLTFEQLELYENLQTAQALQSYFAWHTL